MMNGVNQGNIGCIIVKDMSRLGRDYLKVGQCMEILRQKGVRLIAINDNVDSFYREDDFTPFRNIMNEWYARDTSRKIQSTFRTTGERQDGSRLSLIHIWLKEKYQTIGNLNSRWCTTFWSHTYQSFDDIESPSEIGETQLHALNLDWKRFVTHQTRAFMRWEIKAVRDAGSSLPVTAHLMYYFDGLDYFKLAKDIDVVSWDTYPTWGKKEDIAIARDNAMCHDLMRSLKKKPFFQMESCQLCIRDSCSVPRKKRSDSGSH